MIRFLLCAIMLKSKLSLVIGLTRLDIANPDILAHVLLLDWMDQEVDLINCDHKLIRVEM